MVVKVTLHEHHDASIGCKKYIRKLVEADVLERSERTSRNAMGTLSAMTVKSSQ